MRNLLCALLLALCTAPAFAALGESGVTASPGLRQLRASALSAQGFSVRESQLPSGTLINEYINASGIIFAVSWQGPNLPNLRELLGTYFQQYVTLSASAKSGYRHTAVRSTNLVVQSHGHMRAFKGKAYLPNLLPSGFSVSQIQ